MKNIYLCASLLKCCFLHLNIFLPEEHTPLWKCLIEEYSPLSELTEMVFSTLEKVFYSKNLHLSGRVFHFFNEEFIPLCKLTKMAFFTLKNAFCLKNIYLCASWLKWYLLYLKLFSTLRIYTSVRVFFNFFNKEYLPMCELTNVFYLKNIHLCASWLKWCLLYLKLFSNLRIYTSVQVFFNFFNEEYLPLC